MGVETVWIIDPKTRTGRMCVGKKWIEASRLEVKEPAMFVDLTTCSASSRQAPEFGQAVQPCEFVFYFARSYD